MKLRLLAAVGVSVLAAAGAQAQDYPSRPIALVLPFAAGSGIDPTARIVGDELGARSGSRSSSTTSRAPTARWRPAPSPAPRPTATPCS
jgi:tripartite-type tricarboxylate transporter receptor subunit TctC